MNGPRPLFFIALGLFGLYAVEFSVVGVVGILPAVGLDRGRGVPRGLVPLLCHGEWGGRSRVVDHGFRPGARPGSARRERLWRSCGDGRY